MVVSPEDGPVSRPALVLVGPPGAGKTTVGRVLARRIGATFTDVDALIDINPEPAYAARQQQARDKLRRLVKSKRLGRLRFSRAEGGFVDPGGPAA